MSGRRSFNDLTKDFTSDRRERVEVKKAALRTAMPLYELRQARALTQQALSEALNVNQPAIAKMERRTDMYVSNLRSYIEAMGGQLKIVAKFTEGDVTITNFAQVGDKQDAPVQ
ncbi:XRE family transcriptional regulator [Pelagibacterium halotolerans]|uniref:XRE family transcriptional regulator n=1 Tax=Pelagibacterium halotolerans TaxID=531813 RepID=UPI003850CAFC